MIPEPPRLKDAQLEQITPEPDDVDGASWFRHLVEGADLGGASVLEFEAEQCRLSRVSLSRADFRGTSLIDVFIEENDWANATFEGCGMRRVSVGGGRFTGLTFIDGIARDLLVREAKLDLSNWRATGLHSVHFVECDLTRADFSGADLRKVRFTRCRLAGAQFSNAKVSELRFEECDLGGLGGVGSLAGATIRSDDLFSLTDLFAAELGISLEAS